MRRAWSLVMTLWIVSPLLAQGPGGSGNALVHLPPGTHRVGTPIPVLFALDGASDESRVVLQGPGDRIYRFRTFPVPGRHPVRMAWTALPPRAIQGSYQVWIEADGATVAVPGPRFTVEETVFREEKIWLNPSNTAIRTVPDPEKDRQLREFRDVLNRFNPGAPRWTKALAYPVDRRRITSWFGDRRTYLYSDGSRGWSDHVGVDYGLPRGSPVFAALAGRVVFAQERITTGNTVVVEVAPGILLIHYHLDSIKVQEGSPIGQHQFLGTVGSTGLSTGPHLHFEIQVQGIPVDPEALYGLAPVDTDALASIILSSL